MQSVSGLSGGYQQLINSIILSEKSPQLRMEQKKSDLKVYKGVLTDLGHEALGSGERPGNFHQRDLQPV